MSEIVVAKFGGSSLADSKQFKKVKDIVLSDSRRKYIVPSAPGKRNSKDHKITDLLYMCHELASQGFEIDEVYNNIEKRFSSICKELELKIDINKILSEIKEEIKGGRSKDYAASRGEYLNGILLADYLDYEFVDPKDLIYFNDKGDCDLKVTGSKIKETLKDMPNAVIPGFYGANFDGNIKTFSRGGSDVTGSIIASSVNAVLYENWTDVSGFLMVDPKIVENAEPIEFITYKELRELSYMGAPVLHAEAVFPLRGTGIPINIRNTNVKEDPGTTIVDELTPLYKSGTITGVAGRKNFTVIGIEKALMNVERNFLRKLMTVFETNKISVEHVPSGIDSVSVIISDEQIGSKLDKIIEEIKIYCKPDSVISYPNMALIAVVGRGMIQTKGISAKLFTSLASNDINIRMIIQGASELSIIVGVENTDFEKAIEAIYKAFS